jgi:membrane associated rhomboid family serine protease
VPRDPTTNIRIPGNEGAFTEAFQLDAHKVFQEGQVWRLLTHAFLHSTNDFLHIIFNMLFLWWLGSEVESLYGSKEFLALYLTAAVFSGLCFSLHALAQPGSVVAVGASGAIMAVTVLFAIHYPNRQILLFFVIPVRIWILVLIYVGYDFLVFVSGTETTTAVAGHLGGALFGYLYHHFHWRLTSLWPRLSAWRKQRARPKLRVFREEDAVRAGVPARVPAEHEIDEQFEAKLDAVLEKMSLVGKDNLTESEKDILLRASEFYKRRRR